MICHTITAKCSVPGVKFEDIPELKAIAAKDTNNMSLEKLTSGLGSLIFARDTTNKVIVVAR
jgi:hypothetical protein